MSISVPTRIISRLPGQLFDPTRIPYPYHRNNQGHTSWSLSGYVSVENFRKGTITSNLFSDLISVTSFTRKSRGSKLEEVLGYYNIMRSRCKFLTKHSKNQLWHLQRIYSILYSPYNDLFFFSGSSIRSRSCPRTDRRDKLTYKHRTLPLSLVWSSRPSADLLRLYVEVLTLINYLLSLFHRPFRVQNLVLYTLLGRFYEVVRTSLTLVVYFLLSMDISRHYVSLLCYFHSTTTYR